MKIDAKNRKLLAELIVDGRATFSQIGKKHGMSRQTVLNRVRKLIDGGVIRGFSAVVDEEKIGLNLRAYIFIVAKPGEIRNELVKVLKEDARVSQAHNLLGKYDFIIELLVKDKEELRDFIRRLHALEAVESTETYLVHETLKKDAGTPILSALQLNPKLF